MEADNDAASSRTAGEEPTLTGVDITTAATAGEPDSPSVIGNATPREDPIPATVDELREAIEYEKLLEELQERRALRRQGDAAAPLAATNLFANPRLDRLRMEDQTDSRSQSEQSDSEPRTDDGLEDLNVGESVEPPLRGRTTAATKTHRKQRNIPLFNGKEMKEAKLFLHRLELAFENNPIDYPTTTDKIVFALQWLDGEAEEKALLTYDAVARRTHTWGQFKQFIMDTVVDPTNREISVMQRYERAAQGTRSVAQFAAYLQGLEKEFDVPYTPDQSRRHLLAKLRTDLQEAIIHLSQPPETMEQLISVATRFENTQRLHHGEPRGTRRRSRDEGAGDRPPKKARGDRGRGHPTGRPRSRERQKGTPGVREKAHEGRNQEAGAERGACWNCGKTDHISRFCPDKKDTHARRVEVPAKGKNPKARGSAAPRR